MDNIKTKLCFFDVAIIAVMFTLMIFILICRFIPAEQSEVLITSDDETITRPLNYDCSIEVASKGYLVSIVIDNGNVYVLESTCPDKICVKTGRISKAGQAIVCVPAGITVKITSEVNPDEDWVFR